ncbi:EAL domain-containing protein [Treponema sp. OMZ 792]|uniref:EAL domain-containing protein n=1 Tax=unclassified Treponema TaxID=2638727 RepID=UPI0020A55832|nr:MULTISPECIES: EAL domain-containing protein [unclassified Treponema]UTC75024.1 EAL domain-containing protein [Treponema sp. OMZ 792]UTC76626.1 EAL domain-containing protein [Treponema sp. OMZ 799]UTC81419.1 EAL domain-containing protein [Treponema sp. OMZ 798]
MRLKQKIVLSNALVFSALIIISVFLNFFYAANIFSTNLNNKNQLKAQLIAKEIDEWLVEKMTEIEQTIETLVYMDITDYEECTGFLVNLNRLSPETDYAVFFETGVFANGQGWRPPDSYDPRKRPWYIEAKSTEETVITNPYHSISAKPDTISFSIIKQFTTKNGVDGLLLGEIKIEELLSLIEKFKNEDGTYAFLIGKDYRILSHPNERYQLDIDSFTEIYNIEGGIDFIEHIAKLKMDKGYSKSLPVVKDYDGAERFFYFAQSAAAGWTVGFTIPASDFYYPINGLKFRAILFACIFIIFVSILSLLIAKKVASPIETITNRLEKAAKNNELIKFDFLDRQNHELARIAKSFNSVVKNAKSNLQGEANFSLNSLTMTQKIDKIITEMSENEEVYLLYLDIDKFKTINQLWGYYAGNALIQHIYSMVLDHIKSLNMPENSLIHVIGDEFAIFYFGNQEEVCQFTQDLIDKINREYFTWNEKKLTISISVGIVNIPKIPQSAQEIVSNVYDACSTAFRNGGGCYELLSSTGLTGFSGGNISFWLNTIQKALKEDNFVLYAQAIIPLNDIFHHPKYEILIRLKTNDDHIIMPDVFIPIAERYNLIYEIDKWVIRNTFAFFAEAVSNGYLDEGVIFSINISADSFFSNDLVEFIAESRKTLNVPAHNFCFEITESCAVRNLEATSKFVTELRKQGFSFSLDDFGKGFSSFPYLKTLPIDYVKIDGSFIKSIDKDYIDFSMVKTMRDMCYHLGLYTIGEYAENEQIVSILKDIGVDYGQGYAFQKPIPIREAIKPRTDRNGYRF